MDGELRVTLTRQNADKVRSLMNDLNLSGNQIANLVFDRVSALEVRQVVTFVVEVHDGANTLTRRKPFRRVNVFEKRF